MFGNVDILLNIFLKSATAPAQRVHDGVGADSAVFEIGEGEGYGLTLL